MNFEVIEVFVSNAVFVLLINTIKKHNLLQQFLMGA